MAGPVHVVITASSALSAAQIKNDLSSDRSLQISTAITIDQLRAYMLQSRPNVVLLDTQMAGENITSLVSELSQKHKVPVVLRTDPGSFAAATLLDCLNAGALCVLEKPTSTELVAQHVPSLIWSIKAASSAITAPRSNEQFLPLGSTDSAAILAIGAGMASLPTLEAILGQLPINCPGTLVIPPLLASITNHWISRINRPGRLRIKLAAEGDRLQAGSVLVAPGGAHLVVRRTSQGLVVSIKNGPDVFHQKPSIDVMFDSIARLRGLDAVGVLLGGAGVDGVAGLMNLKNAGCRTIAESATTTVMGDAPGRAIKCGAVDAVEPANKIAAKMLEFASRNSLRAA